MRSYLVQGGYGQILPIGVGLQGHFLLLLTQLLDQNIKCFWVRPQVISSQCSPSLWWISDGSENLCIWWQIHFGVFFFISKGWVNTATCRWIHTCHHLLWDDSLGQQERGRIWETMKDEHFDGEGCSWCKRIWMVVQLKRLHQRRIPVAVHDDWWTKQYGIKVKGSVAIKMKLLEVEQMRSWVYVEWWQWLQYNMIIAKEPSSSLW